MENKSNMDTNILRLEMDEVVQRVDYNYTDGDVVLIDNPNHDEPTQSVQIGALAILLCTNGVVETEVDSETIKLEQGDFLRWPPNSVVRRLKVENGYSYKGMLLSTRLFEGGMSYNRSIWDKAFYLRHNPLIHLNDKQMAQFLEYYRLVALKLANPSTSYHKDIMRMLLGAMFYELLSYLDGVVNVQRDNCIRQSDILFRRFMDMLVATEVKSRFVYEYADRLHVSTKYLSAVCKNVSGRTAGDIIDEFVMKDVIRMLKYSNKSIKEIALDLDFPNISFFGKYVKAHLGMSPKAYRKQLEC